MVTIEAAAFDPAAWLRAGDVVVFGQGMGEPVSLTRRLVAERPRIGPLTCIVGALMSETFANGRSEGFEFLSYGALGGASALAAAGRLRIRPEPYSRFCAAFQSGRLGADVVLLRVAPPPERSAGWSLSLANDYAATAARHARLVILEVDSTLPWTYGATLPEDIVPDLVVEADTASVEIPPPRFGEAERRIAARIAGIVPDGACLQVGIGTVAAAALKGLSGHRDLGFHSGVIPDGWADLVECGALTNARKTIDRGRSVTNVVLGTSRLFPLLHRNRDVEVRPASHTHAHAVLAAQPLMYAINSALQVDLVGRINAETVGGRHVGAVGGAPDFVRGAMASEGGRSIIALPATARGVAESRIVPTLSHVTAAGSDADLVVTEHGIADLRGATLSERAARMIAVAAPEFREDLARSWRDGEGRHGR